MRSHTQSPDACLRILNSIPADSESQKRRDIIGERNAAEIQSVIVRRLRLMKIRRQEEDFTYRSNQLRMRFRLSLRWIGSSTL